MDKDGDVNKQRAKKHAKLAHFILVEFMRNSDTSFKATELQTELSGNGISVHEKTVRRYLKEVELLFGIELIQKPIGFYSLGEVPNRVFKNYYDQIKNAYLGQGIFSILAHNPQLSSHIRLDSIAVPSFKNVNLIMRAINKKQCLSVEYKEFNESRCDKIIIEPYLLVSYLNRYYIVGRKIGGIRNDIRFSLDKMISMELSDRSFKMPDVNSIHKAYDQIVGVTLFYDDEPDLQDVKLRFYHYQYKYFEAEPWVKIDPKKVDVIKGDKEIVEVTFRVKRNNDLVQRILSYTDKVEVLGPKEVINDVRDFLQKALKYYIKPDKDA